MHTKQHDLIVMHEILFWFICLSSALYNYDDDNFFLKHTAHTAFNVCFFTNVYNQRVNNRYMNN